MVSIQAKEREWSTVVDISIPPPYFKPVSLYLSRSLLSKTPKQVFFNPINILNSFTHSIYCFIIYFFRLTSTFLFTGLIICFWVSCVFLFISCGTSYLLKPHVVVAEDEDSKGKEMSKMNDLHLEISSSESE